MRPRTTSACSVKASGGPFEFGVWWMLEKSQSKPLQRRFDCNQCLKEGWVDDQKGNYGTGRTCFLYEHELSTPVVPQDGTPWTPENAEWSTLTRDELFQLADEAYYEESVPSDVPLRALIERMFPLVCPESLLEADVVFWNGIESACETYNQLPFGGSLMEQPKKLMEILAVIRSTKNAFEIEQSRKMREQGGKK